MQEGFDFAGLNQRLNMAFNSGSGGGGGGGGAGAGGQSGLGETGDQVIAAMRGATKALLPFGLGAVLAAEGEFLKSIGHEGHLLADVSMGFSKAVDMFGFGRMFQGKISSEVSDKWGHLTDSTGGGSIGGSVHQHGGGIGPAPMTPNMGGGGGQGLA